MVHFPSLQPCLGGTCDVQRPIASTQARMIMIDAGVNNWGYMHTS